MVLECTYCGRENPSESAVFCMFCGRKLNAPDATLDHLSEAAETTEAARETEADGAVPERVGDYRILKYLGAGGMGHVYEAANETTGKRVAVKLLAPTLAANATSVERFRQEGRLASQLTHPRCVFVYHADADAADGRPFIVMELMPGKTLKELVEQRGPLPYVEAVQRILDVIDGLIDAHRLGLIHRDVKPSNCFLTADDRVKIGDFGLSKSLLNAGSDPQLTNTGAFLGTVLFAPPEQIRGEDVGYDSDVYSVCATLYYLLTGRAPYQHESMTVTMARAISEKPPYIRERRPDVPKALERAIRKGLDRDRKRRYSTLEELRDALQQLLPEEQAPARSRKLIAAYIVDFLLLIFLVRIPVEILETVLGVSGWLRARDFVIDPFASLGYVSYFAILEGFFGLTLGKWLLEIRVVPHGSVGPPGFGVATLRSTIFHSGLLLCSLGIYGMSEWPLYGMPFGVIIVLGGIGLLAYRRRTPESNRGLHDLLTGCHVIALPRRPHRLILRDRFPNRIDAAATVPGLPEAIGGYTVRGRLTRAEAGEQVWVADDRSLGRRVLIHLRRENAATAPPPIRASRLRILSHGTLTWQDKEWAWNAFTAPTGAPLLDLMGPEQPLNWADARLLLEQLCEELQSAERDGTCPEQLSLNHLWCEPGGRLFLLEFPAPAASRTKAVHEPIELVRQAAVVMLEGKPRTTDGPIEAPLPPYASSITDRLCDRSYTYATLEELLCDLAASHAHQPVVTRRLRATQLGIAAAAVAAPIALLFMITQFVNFIAAVQVLSDRLTTSQVIDRYDRPSARSAWSTEPDLREALSPERNAETRGKLIAHRDEQYRSFESVFRTLSRPERFVVIKFRDAQEAAREQFDPPSPKVVAGLIQKIEDGSVDPAGLYRRGVFVVAVIACAFVWLLWVLIAFAFRSGAAYVIPGVTLVQRNGRRAGRIRCAVRDFVLWLPLIAILLVTCWVQAQWPGWFLGRMAASGGVVATLFAYLALGIRHPEQGPFDRIFGVWRVPS